MRLAAYGIFASVFAMGLADFTKSPAALQTGALAILGWIVWYLLVRAFPAHVKAQRDERDAYLAFQEQQREAFLHSQADTRRDFRESLQQLTGALDRAVSKRRKK